MNYIKSMTYFDKINNTIKGKTYIHKKFILNQNKKHNPFINIMINKLDKNNFVQNENSIEKNNLKNTKIIYTNTDSKKDINKSSSNNNINYSDGKNNNNIIDIPISFSNNNSYNNIRSSIFNKVIKPFKMEDKINKEILYSNNSIKDNKLIPKKYQKSNIFEF